MTTSRSMAGAARKSTTSCASRRTSPAPRSSSWSATIAPPAISSAAGHLIAHNEGRLGKTLFTERFDPDHDKVQVHAAWDSEEEARAVGEEIEQLQRNKHKLNDMAILVRAPSRCANSKTVSSRSASTTASSAARASTSASKSATRWLTFASSASRPTTSPSSASSTREAGSGRHVGARAARLCPRPRHPDARRRLRHDRDGRAEGRRPQVAVQCRHRFPPLAVAARNHAAYRACRADPRRERLHGHVAE